MNDNKVVFYIINEEGIREEAQALAKYKLSNGNDYITYTYGEINDNQMIKIYSTGITYENGIYSYKEILTNDEWTEIKNVMKDLARDPNEPIPENIKCDIKLSGEEVSVRKPKKLLVSKKFADTLASKYEEESKVVPVPELTVETALNTPADFILNQEPETKEDILNKTIEIPTFEELQARNKTLETVMTNAKPEPVVEPTIPPITNPVLDSGINSSLNNQFSTISSKLFEPIIEEPEVPKIQKEDYKEKFKQEVEPLLLDVYAKQQQQIEALEEELSKTKFNLFEKQKEALSLKKEKDELSAKGDALEAELNGVQQKMNGILNVIQGDVKPVSNQNSSNVLEEERI